MPILRGTGHTIRDGLGLASVAVACAVSGKAPASRGAVRIFGEMIFIVFLTVCGFRSESGLALAVCAGRCMRSRAPSS